MNFEEKLIRYIASKLIQKKYLMNKGCLPDERKINMYVERVLQKLKEKYRKLKYVRIHSDDGILTPAIREVVEQIKIL
jgi:hypothetical protein